MEEASELRQKLTVAVRERDDARAAVAGTQELPAELTEAREEASNLRGQLDALSRALEAAKIAHDQARSLAGEREKALEKLGAAMESAKQEIATLRGEIATGLSERDRLAVSGAEAAEKSRELQQRVEGLTKDVLGREGELAEMRLELAAARQSLEARDAETSGKSRELQERVDSLVKERQSRERELVEVRLEVAAARHRLELHDAEIGGFPEKLEAANALRGKAEADAGEALVLIGTLRASEKEMQRRIEATEGQSGALLAFRLSAELGPVRCRLSETFFIREVIHRCVPKARSLVRIVAS